MNDTDRTNHEPDDLAALLDDIARLETIVATCDEAVREAIRAYRAACDAIDGEALRRLVRAVDRAAGAEAAHAISSDAFVCAAMGRHGIVSTGSSKDETPPDRHEAASESPRTVAGIEPKDGWFAAGALSEVPEGGVKALTLGGEAVILSRIGAAVSCFEDACAHFGLPLHRGSIKNGVITCPHHAFRFDLATGACRSSPLLELRRHEVRVVDDRVEVRFAGA